LQDLTLQPINAIFQEPFNPLNSVPMHQWLTCEKPSEEDLQRFKILGNVVVPQCAQLASNILLHVARQET